MITDSIYIVVLIVLSVLVLIGHTYERRERKRRWIIKERLPEEIKNARLIGSEQYISTDVPRKMHGTYDQLFINTIGKRFLTDTKTREYPTVYWKDVVQISVYNVILRRKGFQMADYCYFRIVTTDGVVHYVKTQLLTEEEVVREYDITQALINGQKTPNHAKKKTMCTDCKQRENCDAWKFVHAN